MSFLDGFKSFNFNEGVPYVSITNNGVTFNKSVVMKLDYPPHTLLLINEQEKKIAVMPCSESEENAAPFYKEKKSGVISVRWNGRDLLNTISALMDWNLIKDSYKVEGTLMKEIKVMVFDLNKAEKLKDVV